MALRGRLHYLTLHSRREPSDHIHQAGVTLQGLGIQLRQVSVGQHQGGRTMSQHVGLLLNRQAPVQRHVDQPELLGRQQGDQRIQV